MKVKETDYEVIKLLGHGKGGYSYLVSDGKERFVLKQIHHEPCDYYQFGNKLEAEMRDYERLCKTGILLPKLFTVDEGKERILKEYIEGPTVYDLILEGGMKEHYLRQGKAMAEAVKKQGLNIDYFPTNFVVQEEKLYYIDYECNNYMEEWSFENWGIRYWSKTPELIDYAEKHKK